MRKAPQDQKRRPKVNNYVTTVLRERTFSGTVNQKRLLLIDESKTHSRLTKTEKKHLLPVKYAKEFEYYLNFKRKNMALKSELIYW